MIPVPVKLFAWYGVAEVWLPMNYAMQLNNICSALATLYLHLIIRHAAVPNPNLPLQSI